MVVALRPSPDLCPLVDLSCVLPVQASVAFEAFSDVVYTPRWFQGMRDAAVMYRDPAGRATRVHFSYDALPASSDCILDYRYNTNDFAVTWTSDPAGAMFMRGEARFVPLSATTSLMTYRLERIPSTVGGATVRTMRDEASAVVAQFCAHLSRPGG